MKKNKKSLVVVVLAVLVMALVACGKGTGDSGLTEITPGVGTTISENSSVSQDSGIEKQDTKSTDDKDTDAKIDNEKTDSASDNSVSDNAVSDNDIQDTEDKAKDDEPKVKEVDRDDIEVLAEAVTMYVQSAANVRKGPGTDYDIVGSLKQNDTVEVIGKCKSVAWFEIKRGNDSAFVYSGLLGDSEVVPVVVEAPVPVDGADGQEQAATTQAAEQVATPPVVATPAPASVTTGNVVFIGDSRTCQMQQATGGSGVDWVCQYGAKYDWFANTAIQKADPLIGAGTKVVICMGVNDPDRVSDYASCVNNNVWSWVGRGAKVYYVSVNPVEEPYINEKAAAIENFNASMPGRLQGGVIWIDTYSVIKANPGGYPFVDGIHFDNSANIMIFKMIYNNLR